MPEARLERTRRTLPAGYQFGGERGPVWRFDQRTCELFCDCGACQWLREKSAMARLEQEIVSQIIRPASRNQGG